MIKLAEDSGIVDSTLNNRLSKSHLSTYLPGLAKDQEKGSGIARIV